MEHLADLGVLLKHLCVPSQATPRSVHDCKLYTVRPFLCVLTMWKLCGFGKGSVSSKITVYDCTWHWLFLWEPHAGMVGPAWNLSPLSPPLPGGPHLPPHSDTLRAPARPSPSLLGHGVQLSWPSMSW